MQLRSGAYLADLAFDADEPAHAVSSLMVRDYFVQACGSNPLAFAWGFYAHYPKVAIGHWPPLFYCAEGMWMLVAGRNRVALLLLIALCGAALAASVFLEIRKRAGTAASLVGTAVLFHSMTFLQSVWVVRPDMALALEIFWATTVCGKYMLTGDRRSRWLFVALCGVALLTHGRGAALMLLPFALLPLRDRIRWGRWWTAGIVLAVLLLLPHVIGQSDRIDFSTLLPSSAAYVKRILMNVGWPTPALAAGGILLAFRKEADRSFWLAMAALPVCEFVFLIVEPVPLDDRMLLPVIPAIAVLAGGGVQLVLQGTAPLMRVRRRVVEVAFGLGAIASIGYSAVHIPAKPNLGYRQAVEACLLCRHPVALIAAGAQEEGDLIAEQTLRDPQRQHTVLRGSKSLAHSTWSGKFYREVYSSPEGITQFLDESYVSLVVIGRSDTRPHVAHLRRALMQNATVWVPQQSPLVGMDIFVRFQ